MHWFYGGEEMSLLYQRHIHTDTHTHTHTHTHTYTHTTHTHIHTHNTHTHTHTHTTHTHTHLPSGAQCFLTTEPDPLLLPHGSTLTGGSRWVPRLPTRITSTGSTYMGEEGRVSHEEPSELQSDPNSSTILLRHNLSMSSSTSTLLPQERG